MHTKWTKTVAAVLLTASMTVTPLAGAAFAGQASTAQSQAAQTAQSAYKKLTGTVSAQLIGAFMERSSDSTIVGAVVRLKNETSKITRVPDYELRMTTKDGVSYTLAPSAANSRAIQPKGQVELVYTLAVKRTNTFELSKLTWVEVDEYVYPRKETTRLSMDLSGKVWKNGEPGSGTFGKIQWGQTFQNELLSPTIAYTSAGVYQQVKAQGNVTIVTVKATNTGKETAYIPDFAISGSDGKKLYAGEKADNKSEVLGAGESRNLIFAIPTPPSVKLSELVVTKPARYQAPDGSELVRHVGYMSIGLPTTTGFSLASLGNYEFGKPIALDPSNELVDKDVQISLVELHLHDNQGDGYKTAIAKFKLQNTGKQAAVLPAFQAELTNGEGYTYIGDRQNVSTQRLMPGLSHVVSYAFNVPKTEEEGRFALRLLEGSTIDAPYSTPFAQLGVAVQNEAEDSQIWNLYPFQVEMKYWWLGAVGDTVPFISYTYKLTLDLDIKRTDDIVVDAGFSKLKIDIADSFGVVLGSETFSFVGPNRLISGKQTLRFDNLRTEQYQYPLTVNIYEVIDTPSGESARLIQTLQQK
ncbi:DUF4352 domain-containing protein [Cohnella terricola]|uniref:DUF4352 domain-containing protein n=1 Tax=Cohnella terricola TaxID=1289167 RepID=A0A559JIP8_9BACL|nr:DUF4352 domain-containing protein [Cohnella terricola]TVX99750.1 DUF4352 domain-containing protein [Cohnella terricola]